MKTDKEFVQVKTTTQISKNPYATKRSEQNSTNKAQIPKSYALPKPLKKSSTLKGKCSQVELITTVDYHPLDLSIKTNKVLEDDVFSGKMIKIEPSDVFDSQPLDLSVKRKKLVSENNFTICRDDKLTEENKCKLINKQSCINQSSFENKKTLTGNKIDLMSVKQPELVKKPAKCKTNHNWKVLGNAYFHHVFVSVSTSLEFTKKMFLLINV